MPFISIIEKNLNPIITLVQLQDITGSISRRVINDDHLDVLVSLSQGAVDCRSDVWGVIIGWDEN